MNNADEPSPASTPGSKPQGAPAPRSRLARWLQRGIILVVLLAVAAGVFYFVENSRGKTAWEETKKKLEAENEKLDWNEYVPPTVPDDQNFYKAPKMQEWFSGHGSNELIGRLSLKTFAGLAAYLSNSNGPTAVMEMLLRPPEIGGGGGVQPVVPLLVLEKVSVSEAIRDLAARAEIKVTIDPQVSLGRPGPDGKLVSLPNVNVRWTNTTPLSALVALLCNNNLQWVDDPGAGRVVIRNLDLSTNEMVANREMVLLLVRNAIGPIGTIPEGFPLSSTALGQAPPRRLSIAADSAPTLLELTRLYPGTNVFRIEPSTNSLRLLLTHAPVAAEDYLAWSEQFSPEFDKIREAVKRPSARLDGDYQQLFGMPLPNLTAMDVTALRLAGRAKAFLMRNQPENALRELTLLHDFRLCLEGKPSGKGMTVPVAKADVGIANLYVEALDYGLRWQVWHEPELATLEAQLGKVDLVSPMWEAMETERAGGCHLLETGGRSAIAHALEIGPAEGGFLAKLRSPPRLALQLMPRGWLYQNMAHTAELNQKMIDTVDRLQEIIRPHDVDGNETNNLSDIAVNHHAPYYYLAKKFVPPMAARLKTAAQAQSSANQALIVCALERSRLAQGAFPATLHDLTAQFISLLPTDPINGNSFKYRMANGHFLLYSVGWDEKDDHGAPVGADGKGDWIWDRW